jgi:hypothetical protein
MSAPKVVIGSARGHIGLRTHRTLHSAFGAHATYRGLMRESSADKLDRLIGRVCTVIVITAVLALVVNAAFGGI